MLEDILESDRILDISLRIPVKKVSVHKNEDKSLEIDFEISGNFDPTVAAFASVSENETEPLPYDELSVKFYDHIFVVTSREPSRCVWLRKHKTRVQKQVCALVYISEIV